MIRNFLLALVWLLPGPVLAETDLSQTLEKQKSCTKDDRGSLSCKYRVGKDLEFSITGIGEENAGVVFERSNYEGDYYASFGFAHGCVIVHNGTGKGRLFQELAFVSPKNGMVYSTWKACKAGA